MAPINLALQAHIIPMLAQRAAQIVLLATAVLPAPLALDSVTSVLLDNLLYLALNVSLVLPLLILLLLVHLNVPLVSLVSPLPMAPMPLTNVRPASLDSI